MVSDPKQIRYLPELLDCASLGMVYAFVLPFLMMDEYTTMDTLVSLLAVCGLILVWGIRYAVGLEPRFVFLFLWVAAIACLGFLF